VFIEHPPVNSMASFNFTSAVLDEGTTFIFRSWVCVVDSTGSFRGHLVDNVKPKPSTVQCNDLDEFIDKLEETLLPNLARKIEEESAVDATSTRASLGLLELDSIRSKEECT
jgi:hypothetical protein